jgi:hypothetical protein
VAAEELIGFLPHAGIVHPRQPAVPFHEFVGCQRGTAKPGALAPAEAFDADDFLDALAEFDITWRIEDGQRQPRRRRP